MDLTALGQSYREGTASWGVALLFGGVAAAAALVLSYGAVRPLVRAFVGHEIEKVRQTRLRRMSYALVLASIFLGAFVLLRALTPPELRARRLAFQLSELGLFLFAGYAVIELGLGFVGEFLPRVRGTSPIAPIIRDLVRVLILAGIFVLGVKQAFPEVDIGALVTTSAILSVVVGLALQESLSNVFSGIMLTIDRPFKPGDWVEVDGKEGKVLDSNWRSTRIHTREDDLIYIPNSTMAKSSIINLTDPTPEHLCRKKVGIEYSAPPNRVRTVLVNMMLHVDGVLKEPAPDVFLIAFEDSSITYELRYWIEAYDRRNRIDSEVMRGVWYHLKREGISIPAPIRDVYLHRHKPERRPEEVIVLLRRVDILAPLKEEDMLMLAEDLSHHLFARGEAICKQGDPGSTFYIIKAGTVGVKVKGSDGVEAEVARLTPGSYFGEMSLLTGEPRSSTCTALEDCELLCLDRDSFGVLLSENPPVAQAMSDILAARSQATKERLHKERETMSKPRTQDEEAGSRRILEKIRGIFGFRR
ncbi:MAG TPA: mechanosensitive ion channel family protein [Planctomycetota bacterium]|nr:mechanosensitive ion channel family protein [Planctomycetota bacterium]